MLQVRESWVCCRFPQQPLVSYPRSTTYATHSAEFSIFILVFYINATKKQNKIRPLSSFRCKTMEFISLVSSSVMSVISTHASVRSTKRRADGTTVTAVTITFSGKWSLGYIWADFPTTLVKARDVLSGELKGGLHSYAHTPFQPKVRSLYGACGINHQ